MMANVLSGNLDCLYFCTMDQISITITSLNCKNKRSLYRPLNLITSLSVSIYQAMHVLLTLVNNKFSKVII